MSSTIIAPTKTRRSMCRACPFNFGTEEHEQAQNHGCLPWHGDVRRAQVEERADFACHESAEHLCAGLPNNGGQPNFWSADLPIQSRPIQQYI